MEALLTVPPVTSTRGSNTVADLGWYNVIYALSNGRFLDRTEVLMQPVDEVFLWLVYENRKSYDEATFINASK